MISVNFKGKPYSVTVTLVYAPTTYGKDTEVEQFYEDLQDILDLKIKKIFFFIEDWHVNVGSQEIPGVTGTFGFGVQNEAG